MNDIFGPIILFGITIGWFSLPLLPTMRELRKRTTATPLKVDRENDGEIRHFAKRFKAYLEANFPQPGFRESVDRGAGMEGKFEDGTLYRVLEKSDELLKHTTGPEGTIPGIIVFSGPASMPDHLEFLEGIYAANNLECGAETMLRSLYGERDILLRPRSVVLRWIHVEQNLIVDRRCSLYGRASAAQSMKISSGVEFERLFSAQIVFVSENGKEVMAGKVPQRTVLTPERLGAVAMSQDCYSIDKDLDIPAGTSIKGNFVVRGSVTIGSNALIEGSIKSRQDMEIGHQTVVEGSVISGGDLEIRRNCRIRGPVVASRIMTVRTGCRIGLDAHPTSVIAPVIFIHPGVVVSGAVWARERGKVGG
jgi:cytoskeletal protein CcmA (bactofilin family)